MKGRLIYCISTIKYANLTLWKWVCQYILKYLRKYKFPCGLCYMLDGCLYDINTTPLWPVLYAGWLPV